MPQPNTSLHRRLFPILLLFCVLRQPALAQLNAANLSIYSEKEGLPGVRVNALLSDQLGYIWTGTINGLARFDGYEFKRFYFNPNDTATIHGLTVAAILQEKKGNIWVSTSPSYLNEYDPVTRSFRVHDFSKLIRHEANVEMNIVAMCQDDNGRLYFGADTYYGDRIAHALLYKDPGDSVLKVFTEPDSLTIQNVYRIIRNDKNEIWVYCASGFYVIDGKRTLKRYAALDYLFNNSKDSPNDIAFDKQGNFWIISNGARLFKLDVTGNRLSQWDFSAFVLHKLDYGFGNSLLFAPDGKLWLGTRNGLYQFDPVTQKLISFMGPGAAAVQSTILQMTYDTFGNLWIGTLGNGLIKYESKPQLTRYTFDQYDRSSITAGWASNIMQASDGKIWIGTSGSSTNSGITILDVKKGVLQSIPYPSISSRLNGMTAIWEHLPGEMYIGVYNGLYSFSEKNHQIRPVNLPGISNRPIQCHLVDSRGIEWLATYSGLFYRKDNDTGFRMIDIGAMAGNNASSNEITRVIESKKHGLWILSNNGLFLYSYQTGQVTRHGADHRNGDSFITQDVNSLYEDPEGIVWVGTWQGGLSRYNVESGKIKTYTRDNGLPSMSIQGILPDEPRGTLWLSTFEGLSRMDIRSEQFTNFTLADGIQSQLFADGACIKTKEGYLIFGGSNGINVFNPAGVNYQTIPPKVFLTELKIFNKLILSGIHSLLKKPIDQTDSISLPYNQNNVSLEFLALHYSNPAKNQYAYKLENYDNDWRDVGNQRMAYYPNLPPGHYVFRVKAANDKGVWNETGAQLKITVLPPWWRTTIAYFVYGFMLVLLVIALDRYFRYRLVEKEREKNRVRELEQAKAIQQAYRDLAEAHESLKNTQQQLIHAEKMASLGELTAGIAHEIQNPLNFVNNFAEVNQELISDLKAEIRNGNFEEVGLLANDISTNEEKIIFHGKRADGIVKSMLQHSRSSSGKKELTDINSLVQEYLNLAFHGMRARDKSFNVTIEKELDNQAGQLTIVPQEIGRVLLNLFNNAFYSVTARSREGQAGYQPVITVSTKREKGLVKVVVADNGLGMSESVRQKIFQPFFTTKPTGQGTGLGLSLCYDMIKAHQGEIEVESEEGKGAKFSFSLPA